MKYHIHKLELVYPPISNQEAEWVKDEKEVQEQIKSSNLYMIGQKPESFFVFDNIDINKIIKDRSLIFSYNTLHNTSETRIDVFKILEMNHKSELDIEKLEIELGSKLIRFWWWENEKQNELLAWFTTEKYLWDKSRNHPAISGLDILKEFFTYHLHYIGISKAEDSLSRLVLKPHDKRLRILSNEMPQLPGSRPTDEIVLFFFRINTFRIHEYSLDNYETALSEQGKTFDDKISIVADAEKAFIKILNTEYNSEKYNNYPVSDDGMFKEDVVRYSYFLGEDMNFITSDNCIRGKYTPYDYPINNDADFIFIDKIKKDVTLYKYDEIAV